MVKNRSKSFEFRLRVVREYLTSDKSSKEIGQIYNVDPASVRSWARYMRKDKNLLPLLSNSKSSNTMSNKKESTGGDEKQQLRNRVQELEAKLKESELKVLALNTMIDIAEEQGIQIRKKSGAKR